MGFDLHKSVSLYSSPTGGIPNWGKRKRAVKSWVSRVALDPGFSNPPVAGGPKKCCHVSTTLIFSLLMGTLKLYFVPLKTSSSPILSL